jgi:hypothetical protein
MIHYHSQDITSDYLVHVATFILLLFFLKKKKNPKVNRGKKLPRRQSGKELCFEVVKDYEKC